MILQNKTQTACDHTLHHIHTLTASFYVLVFIFFFQRKLELKNYN